MGEEPLHGRGADRQDARPDRLRQYRLHRRRPRHRPEDEGDRLRSVPVGKARARPRGGEGRARRAAGARRHHHAAHAADRRDPQHPVARGARPGPRQGVRIINCARGGLLDEAALAEAIEMRPRRRRRARRVRDRAGDAIAAVRAGERRVHAASRRRHRGGAGERRAADRRADERLPADRRGGQRDQHAVGVGRGSAAAEALHGALPAARRVRRAAHPGAGRRDPPRDDRIRRPGRRR